VSSAAAAGRPDREARLERKSTGLSVADHVRQLIFDGVLCGGDRVPQQEIAEALGVSRIPVREGIVALEREGIVTIEPHRGAFVNRFDRGAIEDHYELFGLIYGHAARRTAERAGPEVLAELAGLAEVIEGTRKSGAMLALAGRFRDVLERVGGSPRLQGLMQSLAAIVPGNFFEVIPGSIPVARRGFQAIAEAIEQSDGEEASARCIEMMRDHGRNVVRAHEKRKASRP